MKLNLGSGRALMSEHINIDHGDYGQEIKRDLGKYLPFNDCTVAAVEMHSTLEHLDDIWFTLNECHRVLEKNGQLRIVVPNGLNIAPDHKTIFSKKFFKKYITVGPDEYDYTDKKWKLVKLTEGGHLDAVLEPVKEAKRITATKLNLGCGRVHKEGYLNVDIVKPCDMEVDVKHGLPFADKQFDLIEADNLMEHLDNDEFMFLMNECHRCLKGKLWMKVPDALNWPDGAMGDPTHKRFFVPRSFTYFSEGSRHKNYGYGFKTWKQLSLKGDNRFFEWTGTPCSTPQ